METKPWDKQPAESGKAFAAFQIYRDMNPFDRSLEKTCEALGKRWGKYHTALENWSVKYNWVKRAEAWDAHVDRQLQKQRIQEWKDAQQRYYTMAQAFQAKIARRLMSIPDDEIPASVLSRWMLDSFKILKDLRGDPTEVVEQRHKVEEVSLHGNEDLIREIEGRLAQLNN